MKNVNMLIDEYRASGNVKYIENMINGAFLAKRQGSLVRFTLHVLIPEFGTDIANEIMNTVLASDSAVHSINL